MKLFLQCMFSPRLFKVYRDGPKESMYLPDGLERWGDKVLSTAYTIFNIGFYTSPFICLYICKRGFFSVDEAATLSKFIGSVGCILAVSLLMRTYGRISNPNYVAFVKALNTPVNKDTHIDILRNYDFEFYAWPPSYSVRRQKRTPWQHPFATCANRHLPIHKRVTIQILAFLAVHTFGLRLIYPGSLGVIHNLLWSALVLGRTKLVEIYEGKRAKLITADGNSIDTMFVDKRSCSGKGKTLVICCEGNSGFYEIGIMTTPIQAGFSALGWNHPGFAGSTGLPYPRQEHNAIDAVMRYAIYELGFVARNIIMFGWSIGGYSAAWAACTYSVRSMILDATFDDLLPLAENQMPGSWSLLVKEVVRSYVDLNVADLVLKFNGPIQIIRRTEDEILCLRQGFLATNRANHLVLKLLIKRHPDLLRARGKEALEAPLDRFIHLMESQRNTLQQSEIGETDRYAMVMINKYMKDFKSTHCTPLPDEIFQNAMFAMRSQK